ncbi:MAG: 30S ribosomal protein S15 [Candidatus Omnitrophica bacterium]|nr:30S ribosomal protein S15 [Candidatus Omnitrophota bacterium]
MKLSKAKKEEFVKDLGGDLKNTGATEVQIAIFTERINYLTDHIKEHVKDHHSRFGLIQLVNKRRKLLDYLQRVNEKRYQELIQRLNIRK